MDEVKDLAKQYEQILPKNEYRFFKKILGLNEQEGDFVEVAEIGIIDKSISQIVLILNEKQYITISSCSGIRQEHKNWNEDHPGYISFHNTGNNFKKNILKEFSERFNLKFDEEEVYLKPAYTIRIEGTDEHKTYIWNKLVSYITNCDNLSNNF
jgi:hypothetical protein